MGLGRLQGIMLTIAVLDQDRHHLQKRGLFRRKVVFPPLNEPPNLGHQAGILPFVLDGAGLNFRKEPSVGRRIQDLGAHGLLQFPRLYSWCARMCRMKSVWLRKLISAMRRYRYPAMLNTTYGVTHSALLKTFLSSAKLFHLVLDETRYQLSRAGPASGRAALYS